jgi:regulatory Fis family protein
MTENTAWNKAKAARLLGIDSVTIYRGSALMPPLIRMLNYVDGITARLPLEDLCV